eukprot:8273473-Pyramimonas_sp.AAC.2
MVCERGGARTVDEAEHGVELEVVRDDGVAVLLQHRDAHKQVEVRAQVLRPQRVPQPRHLRVLKLALKDDQNPSARGVRECVPVTSRAANVVI